MKLRLLLILLFIGGLCTCAPVVNADIIAEFEDGGTPGVDTVPGIAGDGWASPWSTYKTGTGSRSISLVTDDPIYEDSGNNMSFISTSTSTNWKASAYREYEDYGDLDISEDDYQVSFAMRIDDLNFIDGYPDATSNRLYLFGSNAYVYSHDASKTTWCIRVQSIPDDPRDKVFRFIGNNGSDYSDVSAIEDHVYEFRMTVHPTDYTFEGYVKDVTTGNDYTTTTLNYESTSSIVGNYLSCLVEMKQASTFGCSVDNVRIAWVPEPGMLVLVTGLLAGLLIRRRK